MIATGCAPGGICNKVAGILAPWITPYDPFAHNLEARMIPPSFMEGGSPANFLGTDQLGRDYLSRLIWGCRISMLIGVTETGEAAPAAPDPRPVAPRRP